MSLFSIIICAYNPSEAMLRRVLDACLIQETAEPPQVILVDNNSDPALASLRFVSELGQAGKVKLISEKRQGLLYARLAGVHAAASEFCVFMDDDNVPDPGYLTALASLIRQHPQVAVWGPGNISVEYPEGAPQWVKSHFSWLFQEKHNIRTQYGSVAGWPDYYPAGSGMAVKKSVMEEYARQVQAGNLSLTGRKGHALSSGEDAQIVWTAVKMGLAAGTSPSLRLVHVIPRKRTSLKYLAALNFGIAASYASGMKEIFPESSRQFRKQRLAGKVAFALRQLIRSKGKPLLFYRLYTVGISWFKGIAK